MRLMEQIQALRSALRDVPLTLLTTDAERVLDGVFASLDIVERSEADQPVVVLVGPTGAGKSYVFNAIIGADVSREGVLRPTTSSVVIAGELPSGQQPGPSDAVVLPGTDMGITLVDAPELGGSPPDMAGMARGADLVVMVVSPIRYADATVSALWESLDHSRATVVLNRVTTDGAETRDLTDSVTETFGVEPYVIGEHGEGRTSISNHIMGLIPASRSDVVASIMVRAAGAGARFVVREVTSGAPDIGKVASAVDGIPECETDASRFDIQVSWNGTRDGITKRVAIDVRDRDDNVVRASGTELAERILESAEPWDDEDLSAALDAWCDLCISTFSDSSTVRWRRSSARQLIERFSWSTAINPDIVAPKRFSRILGSQLDVTTTQMRSALETLVCEHVDARMAAWSAELARIGDYQPGALASAADDIDSTGPVRD